MRRLLPALMSGFLLAPLVQGQVGSFRGGGTELGGVLSQRERLDAAMRGARWTFGALALDPLLSLGGLTYRDNVFGEARGGTSDLTATAQAGLTGFLAVREDVTLTFHARPSYTWWQDLDERSRLNQEFGAGLFATFNRLGVAVQGRRRESLGLVTEQVSQEINARRDVASVSAELDLYRSLSLLVGAEVRDDEHLLDREEQDRLAGFRRLDRTSTTVFAGFGLDLGRLWSAQFVVVEQETESARQAPVDVSSSGTGYRTSWRLDGNRLQASLTATKWDADPEPGSLAPPFDSWTWDGLLRLTSPDERNLFDVYARKNLQLALGADFADFESERYGVTYHRPLTTNLSSSVFAEFGDLGFRPITVGSAPGVSADRSSYGARLGWGLRKYGTLTAQWAHVRIESEGPIESSEASQFGVGISIGLGSLSWP